MNINRKLIALAAIAASMALPVASFAQSATSTTSSATASAAAVRSDRPAPPFAAIAKELGLSEAQVKAAFDANRPAEGQRPTDAQKEATATALGTSVAKLDALMHRFAPQGGKGHGPRLPIAQLATATGKTQAEVKAAFAANRPAEGQRPTDAQKTATAAALGISVDTLDGLMQEYRPAHAPGQHADRATGTTTAATAS